MIKYWLKKDGPEVMFCYFRFGNKAVFASHHSSWAAVIFYVVEFFQNMAVEGRKRRKKRKDSTCSIKPPLDFIESPLDGQKYYCTPVQAARRPFLAASMPVDDQVSMKWVINGRRFSLTVDKCFVVC